MKKLWNIVKMMTLAFCLVIVGACDKDGCSEGDIPTYSIIVRSNDFDKGSVTGTGTYKDGSLVELKATPKEGYEFVSWNDGFKYPVRNVLAKSNKTYTATFQEIVDQYVIEKIEIYVEEFEIINYPLNQKLPKSLMLEGYTLSETTSVETISECDFDGIFSSVASGLPLISTTDGTTFIKIGPTSPLTFYANRSELNKFSDGETITFKLRLGLFKTSYEIDDGEVKYDDSYDNREWSEVFQFDFAFGSDTNMIITKSSAYANDMLKIVTKTYITKI